MEFNTHRLENGIRLVHHTVPSDVAHCGILMNTGSRDEMEHEHGMAHFIEHLMFKGTKKRRAYHILSRLEDVGGELNAYTTKEETCIYASFLKKDYDRALELISDITYHSIFPEKEIEREKEVIIDEINSYKDNPAELIFDDFEEMIFNNQPLGRNILGDPLYLKGFTLDDIRRFMKRNYYTDEMVVASVGNIEFSKLVRQAEKYFGPVTMKTRSSDRILFDRYQPIHKTVDKHTHQAHCILGNVAYDVRNEKRTALYLLNNILGGQGLNSRLNMSLREKNGYAYNVESSYSPYNDTGVISIYFGTDRENIGKSLKLANREFQKLKTEKLGILQLKRAKYQMLGQLARSFENHEGFMQSMAKSLLVHNRVDSFAEIRERVERITPEDLCSVANEVLHEHQISQLIYT